MYKGRSVTIPCGRFGFIGTANDQNLSPQQLIVAENIRYQGKTWQKAPGASLFNDTPITDTPVILGALAYQPSTATQRIITATSTGKLYKEVSGDLDSVELDTGLSFTHPVSFVECGREVSGNARHLIMFSQGVVPQVLADDGSSTSNITGPTDWTGTDQPAAGTYHDNRVAAWGSPATKDSIYFSALLDHTDFSDGNPIVDIAPGFSDRVTTCFSLTLSQIPYLYIWKYPLGIFKLDTSDITANYLPIKVVRLDVGGAGPHAIARGEGDVYFVSHVGHIHSLSIAENSEDLQASDLTASLDLDKWVSDNVDLTMVHHTVMQYDPNRKELHVMYRAKTAANSNGVGLVIDLSEPGNPKVAVENRAEIFETMFPYYEATGKFAIYSGGVGGLIYKLNQESRNLAGAPYNSRLEIPETDLSEFDPQLASMEKRWDWAEILVKPTGNYALTMDVILDGVVAFSQEIILGASGGALDSFVLDTDTLGGGRVVRHKVPLYGRSARIGLRFYNAELNENFELSQIVIHFREAGNKGTH